MASYAIGDVHGCYDALQKLLQHIDYRPDRDRLIFIGDLVNTGPDSLQVLRFIAALKNVKVILGNHDLVLLAQGFQAIPKLKKKFKVICQADDGEVLLHWLRHQSLLHHDVTTNAVFVHAGLPPQWTIQQAALFAAEVEAQLRGESYKDFLSCMYGAKPDTWSDDLSGFDRLRYIVNAFTRMRFCTLQGQLEFNHKSLTPPSANFKPWFDWYERPSDVFFGHWAWLKGHCDHTRCFALDTGCVYGGHLTAINIETKQKFHVEGYFKP